jgi:hypothetical protein
MALSDNKFRLQVALNKAANEETSAPAMSVSVNVIRREDDTVIETEHFEASKIGENVRPDVALYGLSKLLQDRSSDTPAGPGKLNAMREVFALLESGTWERERKAGAPVVSAEVEALAALKGVAVAEIQTALRKYTKEQREQILANPAVVERAKAIRASRETSEVSLDDLTG